MKNSAHPDQLASSEWSMVWILKKKINSVKSKFNARIENSTKFYQAQIISEHLNFLMQL